MPFIQIGDIRVLSFGLFEAHPSVTNIVTTRIGGGSSGEFAQLNLGLSSADDRNTVVSNRRKVVEAIGASLENLTVGGQVHGWNVSVVTESEMGRGCGLGPETIPDSDGIVTGLPGVPLMVTVADCVALSLYDPEHHAVGVAHAGWRGTVAGIGAVAVAKMTEVFSSDPSQMIAGVSPAIGPCCYEVGEEVINAFYNADTQLAERVFSTPDFASAGSFAGAVNRDTKHLDLWLANKLQLLDAGLREPNIDIPEICTSCHPDTFYSHRGENGKTGRMANIVMLRGKHVPA